MRLAYDVLESPFLRLEPMDELHREAFQAACNADTETWAALYPFSWAGEHFEAAWARMLADRASRRFLPYAIMMEGRCAGISGYLTPDDDNSTVEIGGTWYRPDLRGGVVNPAAKRE